jgi:transposase
MSNKREPYNTYKKEFKLEALRMMEQSDRPANNIKGSANLINQYFRLSEKFKGKK